MATQPVLFGTLGIFSLCQNIYERRGSLYLPREQRICFLSSLNVAEQYLELRNVADIRTVLLECPAISAQLDYLFRVGQCLTVLSCNGFHPGKHLERLHL